MTFFSYEPATPEEMGLFAEDQKSLEAKEDRKKVIKKAVEDMSTKPTERNA